MYYKQKKIKKLSGLFSHYNIFLGIFKNCLQIFGFYRYFTKKHTIWEIFCPKSFIFKKTSISIDYLS